MDGHDFATFGSSHDPASDSQLGQSLNPHATKFAKQFVSIER